MGRAVWVDVTDSEPLVDEPVGFVVRDLQPGSDVVVRATTDLLGCCYQAEARFTADESGARGSAGAAAAGVVTTAAPIACSSLPTPSPPPSPDPKRV
ncbi:MAG: hypothetical protein ACXV3F_15500 [Frankiaceae bacterium]